MELHYNLCSGFKLNLEGEGRHTQAEMTAQVLTCTLCSNVNKGGARHGTEKGHLPDLQPGWQVCTTCIAERVDISISSRLPPLAYCDASSQNVDSQR